MAFSSLLSARMGPGNVAKIVVSAKGEHGGRAGHGRCSCEMVIVFSVTLVTSTKAYSIYNCEIVHVYCRAYEHEGSIRVLTMYTIAEITANAVTGNQITRITEGSFTSSRAMSVLTARL